MRRRGFADGDLPRVLLRYDETDWVGVNPLDPGPVGDAPAVRWGRARRAWVRQHPPQSLDELNRLYAEDVVWPPRADPRTDRRLMQALGGMEGLW